MATILKAHKWNSWKFCSRLVKGLSEPYQSSSSASFFLFAKKKQAVNVTGDHCWSTMLQSKRVNLVALNFVQESILWWMGIDSNHLYNFMYVVWLKSVLYDNWFGKHLWFLEPPLVKNWSRTEILHLEIRNWWELDSSNLNSVVNMQQNACFKEVKLSSTGG